MSARPRPVTATVNHSSSIHDLPESRLYRRRSLSLSSGSSTASLVSVLDHDSYESLSDAGSDHEERKADGLHEKILTTGISEPQTAEEKELMLSSWEQWLVRKAKEDREKHINQKKKVQLEKLKKEQEEAEKQEKLKKAEEKTKEWIEKKDIEEKKAKKRAETRMEREKRKKEEEKKEIQEKSERRFQDWMERKKQQEKEMKEKEKEKKKLEEQKRLEKEEKNKEAFEQWVKKAQTRPKSAPVSYGIIAGKVAGYYNSNAYPTPSFCNPNPWYPIPTPAPKTERKKRHKPKYKWNPKKYL